MTLLCLYTYFHITDINVSSLSNYLTVILLLKLIIIMTNNDTPNRSLVFDVRFQHALSVLHVQLEIGVIDMVRRGKKKSVTVGLEAY